MWNIVFYAQQFIIKISNILINYWWYPSFINFHTRNIIKRFCNIITLVHIHTLPDFIITNKILKHKCFFCIKVMLFIPTVHFLSHLPFWHCLSQDICTSYSFFLENLSHDRCLPSLCITASEISLLCSLFKQTPLFLVILSCQYVYFLS